MKDTGTSLAVAESLPFFKSRQLRLVSIRGEKQPQKAARVLYLDSPLEAFVCEAGQELAEYAAFYGRTDEVSRN